MLIKTRILFIGKVFEYKDFKRSNTHLECININHLRALEGMNLIDTLVIFGFTARQLHDYQEILILLDRYEKVAVYATLQS